MDEALSNIKTLNKQIADEGYVLLKNEKVICLSKKEARFQSLENQWNYCYRPRKSGFAVNSTLKNFYADKTKSGEGPKTKTNGSFWATGETPQASYTDDVKQSCNDFNDVAVVVFSRSGGEGSDLPRSSFAETKGQTSAGMAYPTREQIESGDWVPVGGAGRETNPFEHYLEIDDNEKLCSKLWKKIHVSRMS